MNYINQIKSNNADINQIHEAIKAWHDIYKGDLELVEFLGLTNEEYALFIKSEEEFYKYMYKTYGIPTQKEEFDVIWDDDGVFILDWIKWHIYNNDFKDVEVEIKLKPFDYNEDGEKVYL